MKSYPIFLVAVVGLHLFAFAGTELDAADKPLPKQVDLRPRYAKFGLPPRAQGPRDTCSLFAVTGVAEYELAKSRPGRAPRLSEEYLVWAANEATGLTGDQAMFIEAVEGLSRLGICTEADMPYEEKTDPKRTPTAAARADAHKSGH